MKIKNGDKVISFSEDGPIEIGEIKITKDHEDENGNAIEGDLYFPNGGSVSPVHLEECEVVSQRVYNYVTWLQSISHDVYDIAEKKLNMKCPEY